VKPTEISGIKKKLISERINVLATNGKNKNSRNLNRGINEYKRGYQSRSNLVKDENDLADSYNILNRWKNYFSHLLNVHIISVVRQIHTAFIRYWRKNGSTMRQLFTGFKKAYDSVRREVLHSILIEFKVPTKQRVQCVWVNICLIVFLSRMVYNKEMLYLHCFATLL
jgi:hypothetical protein